MLRIAINGFGRIGRMVLRALYENNYKGLKVVAINNRASAEISAFLLERDTVHGKFNQSIKYTKDEIIIGKDRIQCYHENDPINCPWDDENVDIVLECTGKFNSKEKLIPHIKNGAKKVIVSAPCKNADKTVVFGVNENVLKKNDQIISAASCTTNCLAPVANILNNNFEIEKGFMTTIHSYTSDQRILDNSHKDPRRARSANQSIVPTSTGASKAIGEIIPSLKGKLEGVAMRVPTPNVSLIELVFCTKKDITKEKINSSFLKASKSNINKVIDITEEKLVSVDFNHNSFSAVVDASLTCVVGKNMGKISAWYDNEWGFSNRMCDLVKYIHKI